MAQRERDRIRFCLIVLIASVAAAVSPTGGAAPDEGGCHFEAGPSLHLGAADVVTGRESCHYDYEHSQHNLNTTLVSVRAAGAEAELTVLRQHSERTVEGVGGYTFDRRAVELGLTSAAGYLAVGVLTWEGSWSTPGEPCRWGPGVSVANGLGSGGGYEKTTYSTNLPLACEGPHRVDALLIP